MGLPRFSLSGLECSLPSPALKGARDSTSPASAACCWSIAFGFAMVKYYSTPIPGFGTSFPDLVMQEASSLSNSIGMEQARLVETKVTEVEQGLEQPSSVNLHETLTFVVLYVILATVQAVVLMVIGFGLIAQAVLLLVGPIFIPFLVVPKMDWLFWGWFKAFLQYSFYQVVASAFVYIFAKLLLAFFAIDTGGMTVDQWMTAFPAMFIFLLIAIYGLAEDSGFDEPPVQWGGGSGLRFGGGNGRLCQSRLDLWRRSKTGRHFQCRETALCRAVRGRHCHEHVLENCFAGDGSGRCRSDLYERQDRSHGPEL